MIQNLQFRSHQKRIRPKECGTLIGLCRSALPLLEHLLSTPAPEPRVFCLSYPAEDFISESKALSAGRWFWPCTTFIHWGRTWEVQRQTLTCSGCSLLSFVSSCSILGGIEPRNSLVRKDLWDCTPPCQLDHGAKCHVQFFLKQF